LSHPAYCNQRLLSQKKAMIAPADHAEYFAVTARVKTFAVTTSTDQLSKPFKFYMGLNLPA